jgi:hypothetical protein
MANLLGDEYHLEILAAPRDATMECATENRSLKKIGRTPACDRGRENAMRIPLKMRRNKILTRALNGVGERQHQE